MSTRRKFGIMILTSFGSAIIMAIILSIISYFKSVPVYAIPWTNLTFSCWWSVILLPVYLNIILSLFFFLIPRLENKYDTDPANLVFGLLVGLAFGLIIVGITDRSGFLAGLIAGFTFGFIFALVEEFNNKIRNGFIIGLLTGFGAGLGGFFCLIIKAIINFYY